MDTIYSRKKIRVPKIVYKKFNNKKTNKMLKLLIIIAISIFTFISVIKAINPVLEELCKDEAKSIATLVCNSESTKIIQNYKYEDLVTIYKDNNDNVTMIKSNITPINLIISDVAENIQKKINETENSKVEIKLGSFTGSRLFSSRGPSIPIKLSVVGNVDTDFRSEFKAAGINQTLHRMYLQIDCKISILTPYNSIQDKISNQVIIAENVIVGDIPSSYYNLEGLEQKDSLEIIE